MNDAGWGWYVGHNEEEFNSGPFETKEEAVHIAHEECDGAFIVEARKEDILLSSQFDVDRFIEDADDRCYDMMGLDDCCLFGSNITKDQMGDLQEIVRAAINRWQQDHGLTFTPWVFIKTRNLEFIQSKEAQND